MSKVTITCRRCGGTGILDESKMSRLQRNLIEALRAQPLNGVEEKTLIKLIYRGQKPSDFSLLTLQATIRELNRRMRGRKIVLKTNKIGIPTRRYHLLRTAGGDDHGNADPRIVPGNDAGCVPHGRAAAREAE